MGQDGQDSKVLTGGWETMHDQFDVTLEDRDLLGEVELTTNLIIAASESEGHLSSEEIDTILGLREEDDLDADLPEGGL